MLAADSAGETLLIKDLWLIIACGVGAFFMRGAGCTWNDISDRNLDALVERTKLRPIPAGQVTIKQAIVWMVFQAFIAFIILMSFNSLAIFLGIAALIPVLIYPFAKRFTWWPQLFLGITFNWGVLLGYAAHKAEITLPCIIFYLAAIFWTIFYDTIYAFQDIKDDSLIGIKSTARLFGKSTIYYLSIFATLTVFFMLLAHILNSIHQPIIYQTPGIIGIFCFGIHLSFQLKNLDVSSPEVCLKIFKSNTFAGLILFLSLLISAIV